VRDRRREPSGRRELLRIEEHLLEATALQLAQPTDVLHHRHDGDYRTSAVAHLGGAHLHVEPLVGPWVIEDDLAPLR